MLIELASDATTSIFVTNLRLVSGVLKVERFLLELVIVRYLNIDVVRAQLAGTLSAI